MHHFSFKVSSTKKYAVRECNDTDVRLVGDLTALVGYIDICLNELWIPVCDV